MEKKMGQKYTSMTTRVDTKTSEENLKFVIAKIDAGDEEFASGRIISMQEAERRSRAIIDRYRIRNKISP
jgi:hypothetical protein